MVYSLFPLLFLYIFSSVTIFNINFHHINEVFNGFSHSHVYATTYFDQGASEILINEATSLIIVNDYFRANMRANITYVYAVSFYYDGTSVASGANINEFAINLQANITFLQMYDKTFFYKVSTRDA